VPIYQQELGSLRKLTPPKAQEADFTAAKALVERQIGEAKALATAAAANDAQKVTGIVAFASADSAKGRKLGQTLGLRVCGQGGG